MKGESAAGKETDFSKPIFVTQPLMPPMEEFIPYLKEIWDTKILTNGGPFHLQLEKALCEYLGVKHLALFTNGTIALVTALQAMKVTGEVITTPYSFVATAHSLLWNGIKPVFVDIEPDTFNLDPYKIESAITSHTTAIMPVHVYGTPCNISAIEEVAKKHNLKVIYDAAHAFGVRDKSKSILSAGDLSVLSFHATKVFNTFEGGAIVCPDEKTKKNIDYLKNFGFEDEVTVTAAGINGKMSEINAAFGLLQLRHVESALQRRREIATDYRARLMDIVGIDCPGVFAEVPNCAYFPVMVRANYPLTRDELYLKFKQNGIHPRRYFYPLISAFPMYRDFPSSSSENLPVATVAAAQVLCLPIYPELIEEDLARIVAIVRNIS